MRGTGEFEIERKWRGKIEKKMIIELRGYLGWQKVVHLGEPGASCHVRLSSTQNRSSLALLWCIIEVSGMTKSREVSFFYMSVKEKHPVSEDCILMKKNPQNQKIAIFGVISSAIS